MQASITSSGILGGWVSASPANGSLAVNQTAVVTLTYDVSQQEFQGVYSADVLLTTSGQPAALARNLALAIFTIQFLTRLLLRVTASQVLPAMAYVFCAQLQTVAPGATHTVTTNFLVVQDVPPTTPDWPPAATQGPNIYVTASVQYATS